MTLRELQKNLPWGAHDYTHEFNARTDAVRCANTVPGGAIDLEAAVRARLAEKFPPPREEEKLR